MNSFLSQFVLPSPRRLQPWEKEYFRHLEAEWAVLNIPEDDVDAIRINKLIATFADVGTRGEVHRNDLLEFEQTLLRHRSLVSLVQIAPVLRQRFHDVAGDRVFSAYRPTEMPDCAKASPEAHQALYDDLATVVGAIHWRYILFPFNSQIRTTLTLQALLWILAYTAIWAGAVGFLYYHSLSTFLALFITCIYAGVLGGFISALRRMQSVGDDNDSVFVIQGIRSARFWLWFSPLLGGVFAVIALLFFVSGFLGGSVFPDFVLQASTATGAAGGSTLVVLAESCPLHRRRLRQAFPVVLHRRIRRAPDPRHDRQPGDQGRSRATRCPRQVHR